MRLLILGPPKCGKTTTATRISVDFSIPLLSTDSLIQSHGWHQASDKVCEWLQQPGNWIIEGASAVRGLRKWLRLHDGLPDFDIQYMDKPHVPRTPQQENMAAGIGTIWRECKEELDKRKILAAGPKVK